MQNDEATRARQLFGVPYAKREFVLGRMYAICPMCDKRILLVKRKDFESYTGQEYAEHYKEYHHEDQ